MASAVDNPPPKLGPCSQSLGSGEQGLGGPPLVFLHAASYNKTLWLPQTEALQNEFRCVTVDLPAHGAREHERFTFRAAVDAVRETLNSEGIDRAVLIGTSLGGCVAMCFAAQYPERVGGMVLSGCTFDPTRPLAQLILTGEGIVFPLGAGRFTRGLHQWLVSNLPAQQAQSIIASGTHWRGAAQAVRAMRGVDFQKRLSVYPGPVLIVNGAWDWVHRTSELSYKKAAQNARIVLLDGAGHVTSLDAPAAFTKVVREFAVHAEAPRPPKFGGHLRGGASGLFTRREHMSKTVVLVYSGGLDTSVAIPMMREDYGFSRVVTVTVDVGQPASDIQSAEERAKALNWHGPLYN